MSGNGESGGPARPYHPPMNAPTDLDDDARYRALCSRDARFDGRFFVGVTSTGIYCRPICAVKTPRRENCHFFAIPAQAEQAGFRPCLRCRPELAPAQRHWSSTDAGSILLHQALQWLDHAPDTGPAPSATELAARLGVSDRHLRRIFEQHLGVSPLQYRQTRQLLRAKQWLSDTALPVAEVAWRAGFGSVRRFNDAVRRHYGMSPTELRRGAGQGRSGGGLFLSAREPWDATAWLGFLQRHATPGVEQVDPSAGRWQRTVRFNWDKGGSQGGIAWSMPAASTSFPTSSARGASSDCGACPRPLPWYVRKFPTLPAARNGCRFS